MSKIICDVCGTSYPETATQCPICGCVRPGDVQSVAGSTEENSASSSGSYTYVKGGRFSKSNVRKRNRENQNANAENTYENGYEDSYESESDQPENAEVEGKKGNKGLVITAIVLLVAIIAVIAYVVMHFFGIGSFVPKGTEESTLSPTESSAAAEDTAGDIAVPCESLSLDVHSISLDKLGAARMLYATAEPANTTDEIIYLSSDENVVTVSPAGKVTAIGPGQATITIYCGDASVECVVTCTFEVETTEATEATEEDPSTEPSDSDVPDVTLTLNRSDITFSSKGDSWMLYSGSLSLTQITWSSDDETVATISNGTVVAVGSGTTKVYAEYNGQKVSCIIRCAFNDESASQGVSGSGGNITEDGGSTAASSGGYKLYNPYGNADDVSITVGFTFTLKLVDSAGNAVSGVTWSVSNADCCTVSGGTITGVGAGTATVTATYQGVTYSCIVRVS